MEQNASQKISFSQIAQSIPPNVFAQMDIKVAQAIRQGADVIDLSKGNPDAFPVKFVREAAKQAVDNPANARYTPFDGKPEYLQAAANWYAKLHGVHLNPADELFAAEGAVDGLASLFAILLDRGDTVAFADPYYPSYHCMASMLGARELLLPAKESLGWLPDLDEVPDEVWENIRMLVLNYPNNPTGAQAPIEFFKKAIKLAENHHFVILHDYAYTGLGVSKQQASFLAVPGAKEVGVELCSLSKMYAMAGWRGGFIAGNSNIVSHAKQYHYQMGSMVTGMVQDAAVAALNGDQSYVDALAKRYAARRKIVAQGLSDVGMAVFDSPGGVYVWAKAPGSIGGDTFAQRLLSDAQVGVLPGTCFGRVGSDYIRVSLLKDELLLQRAVERIQRHWDILTAEV